MLAREEVSPNAVNDIVRGRFAQDEREEVRRTAQSDVHKYYAYTDTEKRRPCSACRQFPEPALNIRAQNSLRLLVPNLLVDVNGEPSFFCFRVLSMG